MPAFDELLAESDYVMLCVPLTTETRGLINAEPGADEADGHSDQSGPRAGRRYRGPHRGPTTQANLRRAALDVTDPEPLPRDHPLLSLDNVTIAPHLGSATEQTRQTMAEISVENLMLGLAGKPLKHTVVAK